MKVVPPILCLAASASAFQFSFKVPFFSANPVVEEPITSRPRIAIIGAGAGGSSAAFWIGKAKERFGVDVEIDIYEKESYVGGRSTTVYPYDDTTLPPMELGASIFVQANHNLWRASEVFNLTRTPLRDEQYETGVWDGEKLLISIADSWWDTLKVLWRYGIVAPRKTEAFVEGVVKSFVQLYSYRTPKWDNITDLASTLGWSDLISKTTSEKFKAEGIATKYIDELVDAATRVNYGQNVDEIHALEGACSLAATSAASIEGGNFQLFEKFIESSNATLHLNTTVISIEPKSASSHEWKLTTSKGSTIYKGIIFAAPLHSSGISISPKQISQQVPPQPYVHLHVTLLATTAPTIRPEYLNLEASGKAPRFLLTTSAGAKAGGKEPEFNSLSYHKKIRDEPGKEEWAVKIFSKEAITDEWLETVFGEGKVGWVYRKVWDAYPKLPPTTVFPPVKLARGFFYVNSFEPFISTMETETIASRNVVDLLLNEEFDSSICGATIDADARDKEKRLRTLTLKEIYMQYEEEEDYVFGWDC